jgi:hypothetical protein
MAAYVTAASVHDFKLFSYFFALFLIFLDVDAVILKVPKKAIVILKFSMKFQTKLRYESNLKHSSSRSII